ncbi:MAG: ABC transporter ATP-binding protein [Steroidobacteraceae bacterium]
MIDDWRKLLSFFSAGEKRQIMLLLLSTTVSGLVQAVGVASIMPFIAVVADPTLVAENRYLAWAYSAFGFASTNDFLRFLGLFAFVMLLATNLLVGINAWLTFRVCHLGEYNLARRLMSKYLARPYLFLLQRNSSELVKMVVTEIDRVAIGTLMAGINVFSDAVTTLFIVVLLVVIQPWVMTVTLVVLAVAYLLIYLLIMPKVTRLGTEFAALNTEIYKNAHEALDAAKAIKVLGREAHFVERFSQPLLRSSRNAITFSTLDIVPAQSLELVAFGGLVFATVYLIGDTGGAGEILPVIAMLAYAAYRLIPALQGLFDGIEAIRYKTAALNGLWQDYSDSSAEPSLATGDAMVPQHSIKLENISFRYPDGRQDTLSGLTLTIAAGQAVCLAGPTGAGKSTTVDLLLGLLPPSAGGIRVDDTLVTPGNVRAWRKNIGYVPQVIYLIDDTIANNIALGMEPGEIDHVRLERAARIAELHDFVVNELEAGYRSVVGERGAKLSGGQRQRIGIARALYHDPAVLILDEATNELDLATEARILDSLRALGDRTIIFVSHKPSVATFCDDVVVLEGGRIAAQGSYAELTAPDSRHRALLQET